MFKTSYLEEPLLTFGEGGRHVDPKAGLSLYGPAGHADGVKSPTVITAGIVSPQDCHDTVRSWIERLNSPFDPERDNIRYHPPFPGMPIAFRCRIVIPDNLVYRISPKELTMALSIGSHKQRILKVANLFEEGVRTIGGKAGRPNIIFCPWSEDIESECVGSIDRQKLPADQRRLRADLIRQEEEGQSRIIPLAEEQTSLMHTGRSLWNLHSQMKLDAFAPPSIPIQVMMPDTYKGESQKGDPNTLWNISTAIYYKCGGIPWRPARPDTSVCYIGIAFYRDKTAKNREMRTCMAQIFSDVGHGLVLRGGEAKIPAEGGKTPRMSHETTISLLQDAVSLFRKHNNRNLPTRVVVHKTSHYSSDEKSASLEALSNVDSVDLVVLQKERDLQFVRRGMASVLRGSMISTGRRDFCLFTAGYSPYLGNYPGARIPVPTHVRCEHGTTDVQEVGREILKLTKLNWNNASFSDSMPCTLSYTRLVKEVLSQAADNQVLSDQYASYM